MSARVIAEMRAAADTLEARAEGDLPLDEFDAVKLAVTLRDWADALSPPPPTPLPPRPRTRFHIIDGDAA
ncbi:MAG: hypothetical protein JSR72_23380 [Proteobacteria bacterium]|nr:hypothetical protein [Pseudomonadota bacterium]